MGWGHIGRNGSDEAGPSTTAATATAVARRFPLAAQPEMMRALRRTSSMPLSSTKPAVTLSATSSVPSSFSLIDFLIFILNKKNHNYPIYDFLFVITGTRVAVAYQNETKLLGQMLYYVLTTGSGQQTLGEEYCDITQVAGPYGLPPTPARRTLFIVYQTAIPYIAERISSRIASRGIVLADLELYESYGENAPWSSLQDSAADELTSSTSGHYSSTLTRLKGKLSGFWFYVVQRWPTMLPFVRELMQLVLRANLMLFYFEGLYYHISKRAAGIRYVFIGKSSNQRPRYQILGVFLLIQLCVIAVEGLRRRNFTSIAGSVHQASYAIQQRSAGHGLPVLNEEGTLASPDTDKGSWAFDSSSSESNASSGVSKCTLCLSNRQHPTATSCGHVFCWNCITEWCNEKPECPLCRTPITHSSLVCVYHSDF